MFIENEELATAIYSYTLANITEDEAVIRNAILAAIDEATGYLAAKYDTDAIFGAMGERRNVLVLEHCKSLAVWYILRLSNAEVLYDKAKDYRQAAIDWLRDVAGLGEGGRTIAPNLPLRRVDGQVQNKVRMGSNPKFTHNF